MVKYVDGRDVCVNCDGTTAANCERGDIMSEAVATIVAKTHGGSVVHYDDLFTDFDDDE